MLGKQITKLIIVCDNKTKQYANYLRQLIGVKDDGEEIVGIEDGTVDAVVWSEEEYNHNAATISSNEHILFVGANKTSESEIGSMNIRFNKFGMAYGWLGKRGMMCVEDDILTSEEYKEFTELCASYKQYFVFEDNCLNTAGESEAPDQELGKDEPRADEAPAKQTSISQTVELIRETIKPVADAVEAGATEVYESIKNLAMKKKIISQRYKALTVIFYLEGLKSFLEG